MVITRSTLSIIHLLLGSIMVVGMVSTSIPAYACPNQVQSFWNLFRNAALKSDMSALTTMTYFPLTIRGTLDSDPVKAIGKNDFKTLLPKLLATDPGMSEAPGSMEKYISDFERLPASYCDQDLKVFRVGSWVFSLIDKQWFLTMAYVEE